MKGVKILCGDNRAVLAGMRPRSVHTVVTSPPYWGLRDYGHDNQLGLEPTPDAYVANMVAVFAGVYRVLRDDGTLWLNIGDSYNSGGGVDPYRRTSSGKLMPPQGRGPVVAGLKPKELVGIPWMLAFAMRAAGWLLRAEIIWAKPNGMPESVTDRPSRAHEQLFLFTKQPKYYYDGEATKERAATTPHAPGNNKPGQGHCRNDLGTPRMQAVWAADGWVNRRSVWTVPVAPYKGAHFAAYPPKLILPCILAGTSEKGCCPACGAPYVRLVESKREATRPAKDSKVLEKRKLDRSHGHRNGRGGPTLGSVVGNRDHARHVTQTRTTGWQAGCQCNAGPPVPCVVLDPFAGSGTTLAVAARRNRRAIGIELNPEYIPLIEARVKRAIAARGLGLL